MNRIIIDSDIPYIEGILEPFVDSVVYLKGSAIDSRSVINADLLIIRTRTKVNAQLLDGSSVRFVATATIGTDHIDLDYCAQHGIEVFRAAGCNARAVAQWVFAALTHLGINHGTIGIIGVGNVGGQVAKMAVERNFSILLNDPPRAMNEKGFTDLDSLLCHSDIVTIHTPLNDSTRLMVSDDFLGKLKPDAILLNSSRGEVIDQQCLLNHRGLFCLDVWHDEPNIDLRLMRHAAIATPHVAGYSSHGKARATQMCVRAVAQFLGINELTKWDICSNFTLEDPASYDIMIDDKALRNSPQNFESIRRIRE